MSGFHQDHGQTLKDLVATADDWFRVFRKNIGDRRIDLASLALYRHLVHMADGIEVLLSIRAARPAIPLLRSAFEAFLSLAYIHERDAEQNLKDYENRSLAWGCHQFRQRITELELVDSSKQRGKQLQTTLKNTFPDWPNNPSKAAAAEAERREIIGRLKRPPWKSVYEEYEALRQGKGEGKEKCKKNKKSSDPPWYSLCNGPPNLYALSECLNLLPEYRLFYQRWSAIVHGTECKSLLRFQANGSIEFDRLRGSGSDECDDTVWEIVHFVTESTQLMVKKFGHGS